MPEPKDGKSNSSGDQDPALQPSPEPIQPTNQQPPSNSDLLTQLDALIDRKLAAFNNQLARENTVTAPQPAAPTDEELNAAFLNGNPAGAVARVMQAQMAGLNQDLQEFKKDRKYTRIREAVKANPAIAPYFDKISAQLDATVDSLQPGQVSQATVELISKSLIGELVVNGKINPTPPAAPLPSNIPVHLRPAAPVPPATPKNDAEPELNENERALARRFGMSAKEFKESQDGDRMVITAVRKETK